MYRDPSEFRERFKAYKEGKSVREIYGLPGYAGGKSSSAVDDTADFLRQYEGFKEKTYLDGKGIPTIGYGFTDAKFVNKGRITRAEAEIELKRQIAVRQAELRRKLGPQVWDSLSNDSKKALTSYHFNYPAGFKDNTKFMQYWRAGRYSDAIKEVDAGWNDPDNPGLRTRRMKEQQLLFSDPVLGSFIVPEAKPEPIIAMPDATRVALIPTVQQKAIDYSDRRNSVAAEAQRAMWAHNVMEDMKGAYQVPIWESPSLPALTPVEYDVTPLKTYAGGKLPGYYEGELPMGEKKQLTDEEVKQVAQNAPHEQGMSGEDPLMSMLVGMKAVRLVGDQLAERRLKQKAEMYKRWREANEQTRDASRAWKMQDADRMARNWGYSDNPLGFLYDIFLDPLANLYTKVQKHPVLGPLIPFSDGKLPGYSNGKIRIKPANRGKFNATKKRTGKTTEELTHSKNPLTRKRAIFAQNAKKWNHK